MFTLIARMFSSTNAAGDDVVIPDLEMTLEWVIHSPPPLHQFEEAPIVVETFGPADPFHD